METIFPNGDRKKSDIGDLTITETPLPFLDNSDYDGSGSGCGSGSSSNYKNLKKYLPEKKFGNVELLAKIPHLLGHYELKVGSHLKIGKLNLEFKPKFKITIPFQNKSINFQAGLTDGSNWYYSGSYSVSYDDADGITSNNTAGFNCVYYPERIEGAAVVVIGTVLIILDQPELLPLLGTR